MHQAPRPLGDLEPGDEKSIRREVRFFIRTRPFRWSDEADLFQECAVKWLLAQSGHNPDREATRRTFLNRVVLNTLRDLWKAERAQIRGGASSELSLDQPVVTDSGDEQTLGDLVPSPGDGPEALAAWRMQLHAIRSRLSPRQVAQMDGLLAGYSMSELARRLSIHRDTLYEDRKRIQRAFFDEGLAPPNLDPTLRPRDS